MMDPATTKPNLPNQINSGKFSTVDFMVRNDDELLTNLLVHNEPSVVEIFLTMWSKLAGITKPPHQIRNTEMI